MNDDRIAKIYNLLDFAILEAQKKNKLDLTSRTNEAKIAHLKLAESVQACAEKTATLDEVRAKFQLWIAEIQIDEGGCINCGATVDFIKGKGKCDGCGVTICELTNSSEEKKSAPIKPGANILEFQSRERNLFSDLKE